MKNPVVSLRPTGKRLEAAVETFLHEEIVIDILRRLPSKDVLRYRCVCRKWRDLMSTEDFVNLHIQSGLRCTVPMVLVQQSGKHGKNQIFLDKWWVTGKRKPIIHCFGRYTDCITIFSQDGFLVFWSEDGKEIIISNPMRSEKVRIVVPERHRIFFPERLHVHGVFFNQTLKEYCLLLRVFEEKIWSYVYKILNLGPKPCTRQILNPWDHKYSFDHAWSLVVNEHLYWLVSPNYVDGVSGHADIMEFDPKTEGFKLLPYPVLKTVTVYDFGLDLVNIDGCLAVVYMSEADTVAIVDVVVDVTVCTLIDRAKESWTVSKYCFRWEVYPMFGIGRPKALAYKDGQLIVQCGQKLLVCNLRKGTVRNFGKGKYDRDVSFFSHIISLASLRNCKSKICIEGEDEES